MIRSVFVLCLALGKRYYMTVSIFDFSLSCIVASPRNSSLNEFEGGLPTFAVLFSLHVFFRFEGIQLVAGPVQILQLFDLVSDVIAKQLHPNRLVFR